MTSRAFLSFAPPDIGDDEIAEVVEALRSGWITTGPRAAALEGDFANYLEAEAALAVTSGTAAMHVALLALGVGQGDAVVLPTMTFSSAAHVVEHVGARPVFIDSEPQTLNIDVDRAASAINDPSVKAIAPVHLHGQPCDLTRLLEMTADTQIAIVDDAAHALPAKVGGRFVGGSGDSRVLTAFSFYATKNLTTGEGGMLTGSPELVEEARRWVLHGMSKDAWRRHEDAAPWRYDVDRAGFKYNLSDIQAAIGLIQLKRLPQMHARRTAIAMAYAEGLSGLEEVQIPTPRERIEHAWHIYAIRLHLDRLVVGRDRFIAELAARHVGASVHFIPVHTMTFYRERYGFARDDFPVASGEFERLVSLPIYPAMTDADVADVINAVSDVVATFKR